MLKSNLATRPFYNERAIHVLVALAAAIVLLVTVLNVSKIVTLSRHSTELSSRTSGDRTAVCAHQAPGDRQTEA